MLDISELGRQASLIPALEAEINSSKQQIIELNNKLDSTHEGLSSKEADIVSLKKEIDRLSRDKDRLNRDIDEKLSEIHATQLILESNKQQSTLAQTQASQALKELTAMREREGETGKENVLMKAEIEKLKAELTATVTSLEALQKQKEQYAFQLDAASDLEIGHSSEMLKLRSKIAELTSLNTAHSKELSSVEGHYEEQLKYQDDSHCKAIEKIEVEHRAKEETLAKEKDVLMNRIKELKNIITSKETEMIDLKQKHTRALEEAVGNNADTHSELQKVHSAELSKLRQKITDFNTQAAAHQQELIAADEAYELKLTSLKTDFNNKVERLKREKDEESNEMKEQQSTEMSKWAKEKEELRIEIEELKTAVKLKDVTSLGAQDELEKERERTATEVDSLNRSHAAEIRKIQEALLVHEKDMEELKESYEIQLKEAKHKHSKETSELKSSLEGSRGEMEASLDNAKASLKTSQAEIARLEEEMASMQQKLADDSSKSIKDEYEQRIETMKSDSLRREDEHNEELNTAVAHERQVHTARIQELEAALATANSNIEVQIKQHTTQLRNTLDEEKQRALQGLRNELQDTVKKAHEERDDFKQLFTKENKLRKAIHNKLMDLQGNIRVICRVRPVLEMEKRSGQDYIVTEFLSEEDLVITKDSTCKIKFEFDQCFIPESSQVSVFRAVQPLCISVLDGFNICIFAYGQTGSGKTFTMDGNQGEQRGIIQRTVLELFEISKQNAAIEYTFKITMLEIYNETIRDLLLARGDKTNGDIRLDIRHNERGRDLYILYRYVHTRMRHTHINE